MKFLNVPFWNKKILKIVLRAKLHLSQSYYLNNIESLEYYQIIQIISNYSNNTIKIWLLKNQVLVPTCTITFDVFMSTSLPHPLSGDACKGRTTVCFSWGRHQRINIASLENYIIYNLKQLKFEFYTIISMNSCLKSSVRYWFWDENDDMLSVKNQNAVSAYPKPFFLIGTYNLRHHDGL